MATPSSAARWATSRTTRWRSPTRSTRRCASSSRPRTPRRGRSSTPTATSSTTSCCELLEKETLARKDLERIFDQVEKRPRITAFNDFGGRTPSDKPPISTPAELAKERGEPWPPATGREPTPVGSYPGGNGASQPIPGGYPSGPQQSWGPTYPTQAAGAAQQSAAPKSPATPNSVPHNYGAPPGWRPATTPAGQTWPPPEHQQQPWGVPVPPEGTNGTVPKETHDAEDGSR